jgi:TP901 family phage tail tape measure protein
MAVTESTTVEIKINVKDQTKKPIDDVKKNATELSKVFSQLGSGGQSAFSKLQASIVTLNQSIDLFGRFARGAVASFDAVFGSSIDLQKGVAGISTLFDSTAASTAQLTGEIISLQRQFGTSQTDLVAGYYEAIASGAVEATSATQFMVDAQKLAIGGLTSLRVSVDGLTTIIGSYGLAATDAARINDALFIGAAAGKTNIEQLASSLGNASAFAKSTGVSFQELIAAVSAITAGGVGTSEAVTQVRSAMVGLSNQTEQLQAVLYKLNIRSIQAEISQNGLVNTLKKILAETDGTTESLTQMFGRVEAVNAVLALTNNSIGKKYIDIMGEMGIASERVGERTDKAFNKMANTLSFKIDQMKARMRTLFTGEDVSKILMPAIDGFNNLLIVIEKTYQAIKKIDFKKLGDDILSMSVAITAVALGFQAWATYLSAGSLITAIKYVGELGFIMAKDVAIYAVAAGKWLLIAAAITAVVAALDILIRNISNLGGLWDLIITSFNNGLIRFQKALTATFMGVAQISVKVTELLSKVGLVGEQAVKDQKENLDKLSEEYKNYTDILEESNQNVIDSTEGIDFGFFGDIFKTALKFVDDYNKGLEKTGNALDNLKGKELPKPEETAKGKPAYQYAPLIPPESLKVVGAAFGEGAASIASSVSSAMTPMVSGFAGAAGIVLQAVNIILDVIPNIINMITGIVDKITDLPNMLLDVNKKLWTSLDLFLSTFLDSVASAFLESFDAVEALPERFFASFLKTLEDFGVIFQKIFVALFRAVTTHIPRLVISILSILWKELPKMVKMIWQGLIDAMPEIGDALVEDLKKFSNELAKFFNMRPPFKLDEKGIDKELEAIGKSVEKSASDVFSVMDLAAQGRGLDVADRIRNAINSSTQGARDVFTQLWRRLEDIWRNIWTDILKSFTDNWDRIVTAWREIWDGTISAVTQFWNLIAEIWRAVWDGSARYCTDLWNGIVEVWRFTWDVFVAASTATWNLIVTIWRAVWDGSIAAATATWSVISTAWGILWNGTVKSITDSWNVIVVLWRGAVDTLMNFKMPEFPSFSWPAMPSFSWPEIPRPNWMLSGGGFALPSSGSFMKSAASTVQNAVVSLGNRFETGGMALPQGKWLDGKLYAAGGAIAQGTDVVPAQLTPGEFVVNREAARSNLGLLSFMNQAKAPISPVGATSNFSIVINTKTDLSPEQIRREIIPTLEKELKRKSQDGKFIIATSGLRTNK